MWLCSICSQLFGRGCERLCSTKCGHVYHYDCLMEWLETSATCPDCRECCVTDDIIMIYLNSSLGPEKVDEAKRLTDIKDTGLKVLGEIEAIIKERSISEIGQNECALKDLAEQIAKLYEVVMSVEDVSLTLSELSARARDIMERHGDLKEGEPSLQFLTDFSARLQRDLDCYAKNYRKVQTDAYENSLQNVTLRSENSGLKCDLAIIGQRNDCLHSAISLLKKEIHDKQGTIKQEIDVKRRLANEIYELQDKNRELIVRLEASEANSVPSYNTIRRLNMVISEKCELISIHTQRIKELTTTVGEVEQKFEAKNVETCEKLEEKNVIIEEQKRRLAACSIQCDQLTDKLNGLERKLFFYEAVVRGVADRKGEPESPRVMHYSVIHGEIDESTNENDVTLKIEKS